MTVDRDTFILFCLFVIYIGGDIYTARIEHKKLDKHIAENDSWVLGQAARVGKLEESIDSIKIRNAAFAKTILYLDSCQQAKAQKADRAEKRGRFVGGLLKGLFPCM